MFTGIIESLGKIERIVVEGTNRQLLVSSAISDQLKPDQSISHDGVCLTVVQLEKGCHWVTAVEETLRVSTLGDMSMGSYVNLERCMLNNGRFDGHIVQGHVDQTGILKRIADHHGSWIFEFEHSPGQVTVEKGSIAVNGVSLTCYNSKENGFETSIIPYTYEHTTLGRLKAGAKVNLEFDIIGKYVSKLMSK